MIFAALLLSAALQASPCGTAAPSAPAVEQMKNARTSADIVALSKLADGSPVAAALKLPALANGASLGKYQREHYPAALRMDSIPPEMALFWLCVDTLGTVVAPALMSGTGAAPLDSLAIQLVKLAQFDAATVDGRKVAVWVPYPVQLSPLGTPAGVKPTTKELGKQPVFTPYTVEPVLTNGREVAQEMVRSYPPRLRSSGMGGTATLWLFVDEKGSVKNAVLKQGTGNRELDDFALGLASLMRFTPATYNDAKVPVWISLPIRLRGS